MPAKIINYFFSENCLKESRETAPVSAWWMRLVRVPDFGFWYRMFEGDGAGWCGVHGTVLYGSMWMVLGNDTR